MTTTDAPVGILGGTFDPIHNGHLRLAMELVDALTLDHVRLVPNGQPPHREQPVAAAGQRAKWIRVAVANEPRLRLDNRELLRSGPSYTVDTLASMQEDLPGQPLCLVMGRDVFAHLPSWHDWQRLFELAHIILISRDGAHDDLHPDAANELTARSTSDSRALRAQASGLIYSHAPPQLAISASRIRHMLATGRSPRFLLPESTLDDIMDAGIYQNPQDTRTRS